MRAGARARAGLARRALALLLSLAALLTAAPVRADLPVLRVAALEYGTVNWELETIRRLGLDEANGFRLEVLGMAGETGARIAFQGGEADAVVADWLWAARQRARGRDYVFLPYSRAVGGLAVPADSPARRLEDLEGETIAIAGGPLDKSWLILRGYALKKGFDLAAGTSQVYAAPPLVMHKALSGEVAGAVNYWHYLARMEAAGMRRLLSVDEAIEALGLDPGVPLLGYVMQGRLLEERPGLVEGFARASRAAKARLAEDPAAWEPLRPLMKARNEAEFEALRQGFLAGAPPEGPVGREAAEKMFALLRRLGGPALVGPLERLPDDLFISP